MSEQKNVRVGVGCLVLNSKGEILVGVRKGSAGAGTVALPGGHLEMNESWASCASREIKEECDLDIPEDAWLLSWTSNDIMSQEGKHYVTL